MDVIELKMACPGACNINFLRPLWIFVLSIVFVPGKPFQHSQMFAGKAVAYMSEAPFSSRVGS